MKITQKEFSKLRDIDKVRINSFLSHREIRSAVAVLTGLFFDAFSLHNLFIGNIFAMEFFFIFAAFFVFFGIYLSNKNYRIVHSEFFNEYGKVKESYLKKYKIKS